jgi:hypothetical protein
MTPELTPKSNKATGQPVNPVAEWWAENPMTYADDHGLVTYEGVQVPFGSIEFFDRVDSTFLAWNKPLHFPAPFGKIFDYQKYQGKKVSIGKPKRGGASGKKFYVYVMNKGKVKKVSFGDSGGLSTKVNDPKARQSFAKRHKCAQKTDRTKASYWSCRIGRSWKSLGGSKNFSGFW